MNVPVSAARRRRRRAGVGSQASVTKTPPFFRRRIPCYELLDEASLDRLEAHADWILQEIGIEIHGDDNALALFRSAGAEVTGERVRFEPGLLKQLCATAPRRFTLHARSTNRSIELGGDSLVFAPAYGSPFVTDLDKGRRYATLEDFENFIRLTYMSPSLQHQSGTVCEPVDVPVNKRHLDMVYAHLRYSDKPFMGSVTAFERAQDSIDMARIVFGESFMEDHAVIQGNINVNSPLVYDDTMTGALRAYAAANQSVVVSPFILGGAMGPVTLPALVAQAHAEAMVGIALTQLVRPGSPVVYGVFLTTMDLKTGAPTFGTPESSLACLASSQLCRRLGLPFRAGGHYTASKVADGQAMQESMDSMNPAIQAGANFIWQAAGWLEGGLTIGYEKFVMDAERCTALGRLIQGMNLDDAQFARDAFLEMGIGRNFLGAAHTMEHFRTANLEFELADNQSFERWEGEGARDQQQRANATWKRMLQEYKEPPMDEDINAALLEFIQRRKNAMADAWY